MKQLSMEFHQNRNVPRKPARAIAKKAKQKNTLSTYENYGEEKTSGMSDHEEEKKW